MLGAVIISMNPVVTALLAATFLGEILTPMRVGALALGVLAVLAALMPLTVTNPWKAAGAVAAVVLLNATLCMTMYVRAVNDYGAAAVAMLFAVIPAVAGLLSWLMLGQRPDIGIAVGLVVGALACWLNVVGSSRQRSSRARSLRRRQEVATPTASIMRASSPATSGPAG